MNGTTRKAAAGHVDVDVNADDQEGFVVSVRLKIDQILEWYKENDIEFTPLFSRRDIDLILKNAGKDAVFVKTGPDS